MLKNKYLYKLLIKVFLLLYQELKEKQTNIKNAIINIIYVIFLNRSDFNFFHLILLTNNKFQFPNFIDYHTSDK